MITETSTPNAETSSRAGPSPRHAAGDGATITTLERTSYRDAATRFPPVAPTTAAAVAARRTTGRHVGPAGRSPSPRVSTSRSGGGHEEGLLEPPLPWYGVKHLPVFERLCRGAPVRPDTPPDSPLGSSQDGGEQEAGGVGMKI